MKDRPGLFHILKHGWNDAKKQVEATGAYLSKRVLEEAVGSDIVQEEGAKYISNTITETVKDIRENTGAMVREARRKIIGEENINTYESIRNSITSPKDGIIAKIFKNVIARVIDGVAGIGSWIGATFINKAFNPTSEVDPNDIKQIFGSFMSKVFSSKNKAVPAGT